MNLVTLKITTELGAEYVFPDLPKETIDALLVNDAIVMFSQISLINQSGACLVIPRRIIKTIEVNGEVAWPSHV